MSRYRIVLLLDAADDDDDSVQSAIAWMVDELHMAQPGWWADVDELEGLGT